MAIKAKKVRKKYRFPIRVKGIILILAFASVLMGVTIVYYSLVSDTNNNRRYKRIADTLAGVSALNVDADDASYLVEKVRSIYDKSEEKPTSEQWGSDAWEKYIAQFTFLKEDPVFIRTKKSLNEMASAGSSAVTCYYIGFVDPTYKNFVYAVDSAEGEDECPPGCIDPLNKAFEGVLADDKLGLKASISSSKEYGYLVTAGAPIINKEDKVVGYSCVDISMSLVKSEQANGLLRLFLYMLATITGLAIIGVVVIHYMFIKNVRSIHNVTKAYDISDPKATHERFEELHLNTHDELEELSNSIKKMEKDIHDNIIALAKTNEELKASQRETVKMTELARRDGLTGVLNKAAYNYDVAKLDEAIKQGALNNFGIAMIDLNYLKTINDRFGHNYGDEALIKLTDVIKDVFQQSKIYRTGGDEFVIILLGNEYKNAKNLIDKFNKEIDSLAGDGSITSDLVSAAIGYAYYDDALDSCIDDVFRRADKEMYVRKWLMKEKYHND